MNWHEFANIVLNNVGGKSLNISKENVDSLLADLEKEGLYLCGRYRNEHRESGYTPITLKDN